MEQTALHFIPIIPSDEERLSLLDLYLSKMAQTTATHLVTLSPIRPEEGLRYMVHCIGSGKRGKEGHVLTNLLALHRRFIRVLYALMPDIVHIHGSYNYFNSRIALWAKRRGFPVVFSPQGGMNPDFIEAEYGMRTWKMLSYQKSQTRRCDCILTSDPKEASYIVEQKLNDRVEIIPDLHGGEYIDMDTYANATHAIYAKLLDSDKTTHLDQGSREAVSALLHLSMAEENERQPLCSEDILNLRSLTRKKWRDIMLFSQEQGITPFIADGVYKGQYVGALPDVSEVEHFGPRFVKDVQPLSKTLAVSASKLQKRSIERHLQGIRTTERGVALMLWNIRQHVNNSTLCLRHLCDLYMSFRYEDIDERHLSDALHRIKLYDFGCRVCQVLQECAYLDEGYTPLPVLNDQGTERIRQNLIKY